MKALRQAAQFATLLTSLLAALPMAAGEYSILSPGIQVEIAQESTKSVPFQSEAGNIQGAQVDLLLGFGLTSQVRLGPLFTESLSSFVLAPSVVYRLGKKTDSQSDPNLSFYTSDGSVVSVQNANSTRTTNTRVLGFNLPLRWYLSGSAVFGGLYFEGGPAWARQQQDVNLVVTGMIQAQQSQISESATITTSQTGAVFGVGYTGIYRVNQASVALQYQSLKGSANQGNTSEVRLVVQWTF